MLPQTQISYSVDTKPEANSNTDYFCPSQVETVPNVGGLGQRHRIGDEPSQIPEKPTFEKNTNPKQQALRVNGFGHADTDTPFTFIGKLFDTFHR